MELMRELPSNSVEMILCDLPYGLTSHKWDKLLPIERLWPEYTRIIKPDGVICLFCKEPLTSRLVLSNERMFRYKMIWEKDGPTGFLNCSFRPLSLFEEILVFSNGKIGSRSKCPIRYYPQNVKAVNLKKKNNPKSSWRKSKGYGSMKNVLNTDREYIQRYTNYPTDILRFAREKHTVHPTQKPVELLEYLIRTYTREAETVLDNCMGSGSTIVACINTNRRYIGYELDESYFTIAQQRIETAEESVLKGG